MRREGKGQWTDPGKYPSLTTLRRAPIAEIVIRSLYSNSIYNTLQIRYAMDNQVFYNLNSNNNASRFRNPQFRSFNPKPKSAPEVEKGLSLSAKPTHTAGGFEECEEPSARTVASPAVDTRLHDSVHVQTSDLYKTASQHYSWLTP